MRARILAGALIVVGILAGGSSASNGANVAPQKQWALVNFANPVSLNRHILMGPYLIVHNDTKMALGVPCTTIYRFDPRKGPQEVEAVFMCRPAQRAVCEKTTLSVARDADLGVDRVTEYQFAGDSEGHGIPAR